MEAIIVPCTQEKIWDTRPYAGAVPAKDAYTKPVFATWRSYAEQSGLPWFILSTKYGLIPPDFPINKYNVTVTTAAGDAAFLRRLRQQGDELNMGQFAKVILLDWERLEPLVRAAVPESVPCVLRKVVY